MERDGVRAEDFESAAKGAHDHPGTYYAVEGEEAVREMIDSVASLVHVGPGEADGYIVIVQLTSGDCVVAGNVDREYIGRALLDTAIHTNPEILEDLTNMALAGLIDLAGAGSEEK